MYIYIILIANHKNPIIIYQDFSIPIRYISIQNDKFCMMQSRKAMTIPCESVQEAPRALARRRPLAAALGADAVWLLRLCRPSEVQMGTLEVSVNGHGSKPMVPYDWVVIHIHKSQLF